MIVNEKALVRAMEDAVKHGGYRIRFNVNENAAEADTCVICTDKWLVQMDRKDVPRKVLGLLTEHFGYLPDCGCWSVRGKDGQLVESFQSEVLSMDIMQLCYADSEPGKFIPISAWGASAAISESGEIYLLPSDTPSLAVIGELQAVKGKSLRRTDENSAVFLRAITKDTLEDGKRDVIAALEKIDWNIDMTPPETEGTEDDGQMEIGDDADDGEGGDEA